jgi:2-haloacid dehalogenase
MSGASGRANPRPAIVWDLGGVLIDWNPRYLYAKLFPADSPAMERFLGEICTSEWNLEQDAGRPFAQGVAELVERHPEHAALIRAYDSRWKEMIRGAIEPSVEILAALRASGYPLHALSNWSTEKFALVRPEFPFLSWFQSIVLSGEVELVKPDRRIFELLLARIGRTAAGCVFIDDSLPNVQAARELGFEAIQFHSPQRLKAELLALGILAE